MGNNPTRIYVDPTTTITTDESYEFIDSESDLDVPPSQEQLVALLSRNKLLHEAKDHATKKNFQLAQCTYQKIIESHPKDYLPCTLYGDLLIQMGRKEEGLKMYHKALTLNPLSSETWIRKARCLMKMKSYEDATDAFENAILSNSHGCINQYVMALLQLSRYDESLYIIDRMSSLRPKDAYYHAFKGTVLIEKEKRDEALMHLNLSMQHKQVPLLTYISLTLIHLMIADYGKALFFVELALSMSNHNEYLLAYQALVYLGMNTIDNAHVYVLKSLEKNPKNHLGLLAKAKLLFIHEQYEEALLIVEGLSTQRLGTNRYYRLELAALTRSLTDSSIKKMEERVISMPGSKLISVRQAVKDISIRHGIYEEDEETLLQDKANLKSKVKTLKEILTQKLKAAKEEMSKLEKIKEKMEMPS